MENHCQHKLFRSLPYSVYSADWVRRGEREAAKESGISLAELMERAGDAAYRLCRQYYPDARHWLVLCGSGNNGGDGYVVARRAKQEGIRVTLLACPSRHPLPLEARLAREKWLSVEGQVGEPDQGWPKDIDLIVDGLLGIGLNAEPRSPYSELISAVNAHPAPVVSLDIPSGLNADSGHASGAVIRATRTLTFVALKSGLLTGQAREWVGELHYADLQLSSWLEKQPAEMSRLCRMRLSEWLLPRRACAHKGDFGKLLLIGGDHGFGGAILMAGEAALRSGAGLVRVLTRLEHVAALLTARPELMVQECNDATLEAALSWADTVVVGPGLGKGPWGEKIVQRLAQTDLPSVWDADALNLLAIQPHKRQNRVLTPHPGEAARLLGCRVSDIESDRLLAVRRVSEYYGGVALLKGAGTLVAQNTSLAIADVGNSGMASGGMGDVLSGIIGALIAQKMDVYTAACVGCVVHGAAADNIVLRQGERGLIATDLLAEIPRLMNPHRWKISN